MRREAGDAMRRAAVTEDRLDAALGEALATMSVKDASAAVAEATGLPRRDVYRRELELAKDGDDGAAR